MNPQKMFLCFYFILISSVSLGQPQSAAPHKWELIQDCSDEFDASSIDVNKWIIHNDGCGFHNVDGTNNGGHNFYNYNFKFSPQNANIGSPTANGSTDGSVLLLTVEELTTALSNVCTTATQNYFYGGQVELKYMTRFGYFEANVKMPCTADNVACDFWLWHQRCPTYENQCRYAEIDIFEMCSIDPFDFPPALHTGPCGCGFDYNTPGSGPPFFSTPTNFCSQFRKVGIDWQPGYVDWYIDDHRVLHHTEIPNTSNTCIAACPATSSGPSVPVSGLGEIPQRLVLDAGISGSYDLNPYAALSHNFEVDYYRHYKKKPEIVDCNIDAGGTIFLNASTGTGIYNTVFPGTENNSENYNWTDPGTICSSFAPNNNLVDLQLSSGASGLLNVKARQQEMQSVNNWIVPDHITESSSDIFIAYNNSPYDVCGFSPSAMTDVIIAREIFAPGICIPSLILSQHDAYFLAIDGITLNAEFEVQEGATFTADIQH